ncbi:MAG: hypothetical protein KDA83_13295 [Planctomycetales bacterium]|nr:hypothetical protein [Planctomycetales bacterium]
MNSTSLPDSSGAPPICDAKPDPGLNSIRSWLFSPAGATIRYGICLSPLLHACFGLFFWTVAGALQGSVARPGAPAPREVLGGVFWMFEIAFRAGGFVALPAVFAFSLATGQWGRHFVLYFGLLMLAALLENSDPLGVNSWLRSGWHEASTSSPDVPSWKPEVPSLELVR